MIVNYFGMVISTQIDRRVQPKLIPFSESTPKVNTIMKARTILTIVTFVLVISQVPTFAQIANKSLDGWTLLGTRTVDYTLDRDVVSITNNQIFSELKLMVKNGTLKMHKCTVHFEDGDTKDISFTDDVNKTNDGRILDLKGSNRTIEKVTFWYDTKNDSKNKSIVELWGKK